MAIKIISKEFSWNEKLAEKAQETFNEIRGNLSYGQAQSLGMALAKLELLEEQGAKVYESGVR